MSTVNQHHIGEEIDNFFQPNVLKYFLKTPLKFYTETINSVYRVFSDRLTEKLKRKEAFVTRLKEEFIANILFKLDGMNVFLAFVYLHDTCIAEQENYINGVIQDHFNLKPSAHSLSDEPMPDVIKEIVNNITLAHIDRSTFRLSKHQASDESKTVIFQCLALLINPESNQGITVVAGFEYENKK